MKLTTTILLGASLGLLLALLTGCEQETFGSLRQPLAKDLFHAADKLVDAIDRNTAAVAAQTDAITLLIQGDYR